MINRYRITGKLTVKSPLHVGDGDVVWTKLEEGKSRQRTKAGDPRAIAVRSVCCGCDLQGNGWAPYVPGSSLKGALRGWAERYLPGEQAAVREVFGEADLGGKAIVEVASLRAPAQLPTETWQWWSPERSTCISANVTLDARTRTAADRKLRHAEFVPEGSVFSVTIVVSEATEGELDLLLFVLEAFEGAGFPRLTLGAGAPDGWGEMGWGLEGVERCEAGEARSWVEQARGLTARGQLVPAARGRAWRKLDHADTLRRARGRYAAAEPSLGVTLTIDLELQGGFLVNDPSQERKGDQPVAHAPLRKRNQRAYLPASSFRGALRAQARAIWRTLQQREREVARGSVLFEAKRDGDERNLFAFHRLFGATGWSSPLRCSDFVAVDGVAGSQTTVQEFLAIDRFTGAGAESRKFNAHREVKPRLRGTLRIDVGALRRAECGEWAFALLLYTLRDLVEGDIWFGWGASKGYGATVATVQGVAVGEERAVQEFLQLLPGVGNAGAELRQRFAGWAEQFQAVVREQAIGFDWE